MVLEIKGHGIVLGVLFEIYVGRGTFSWIIYPPPQSQRPWNQCRKWEAKGVCASGLLEGFCLFRRVEGTG